MFPQAPVATFLIAEAMASAPQLKDAFQTAVAAHSGSCLPSQDSALIAVFDQAEAALEAALLLHRTWQVQTQLPHGLRSALHAGPIAVVNGVYFGTTRNRAYHFLRVARPGQIIVSRSVAELVSGQLPPSVALRDLGPQRLRDLLPPEQLFTLQAPELPDTAQLPSTLATYTTNLPIQPTPFLGREREVQAIQQRIAHEGQRLITLVAPSGLGKTRFALEVASRMLDDFPHGVFFIPLAPIEDVGLVIPTIAHTLGLKESSTATLLEQLQYYLRDRRVLLVIDNIEQVVAVAPDLEALLSATHDLVLLVTSHVPLQVSYEAAVSVPPLDLPALEQLPPIEQLLGYTSIALFLERVQAVHPGFVFDAQSADLVAHICDCVGGVPLAIELVAAYGDTLSLPQLLKRLQDSCSSATRPEKHLVLPQVLDWSYSLLEPATQTLFARLGVFVQGCTLEAAEAVCQTSPEEAIDVVNEVATLLRRNLLLEEELDGDDPRYIMLDCIHDYALARLEERGEVDAIRRSHAEYYRDTSDSLGQLIDGPQQGIWIRWMAGEQNNLRAAFNWALQQQDGSLAVQICAHPWFYSYIRGYAREGLQWIEAALPWEAEAPLKARGFVHNGASCLYASIGEHDRSIAHGEQSLAIWRTLGYQTQEAYLLHNLGSHVAGKGDYVRAKAWLRESMELQSTLPMGPQALTPANLGQIAIWEGDYAAARSYLETAVELARKKDEARETATVLVNIGVFYLIQVEHDAAVESFREALTLARQIGGVSLAATSLEGLAWVASAHDEPLRAAHLLGAAEAQRETVDQQRSDIHKLLPADQLVQKVREQLSPQAFDTAWTEGRALPFESAIAFALEGLTEMRLDG